MDVVYTEEDDEDEQRSKGERLRLVGGKDSGKKAKRGQEVVERGRNAAML